MPTVHASGAEAPDPSVRTRSTTPGIVSAAALPLLGSMAALGTMGLWIARSQPVAGADIWAAIPKLHLLIWLAVAATAVVVAVVCLVLRGLGWRIPAAACWAAGILPWLAGEFLARPGLAEIDKAVAMGVGGMGAVAAGLAEIMLFPLSGSWFACWLLASIGAGLLLLALGERERRLQPAGILPAAAMGLPALGLIVFWVLRHESAGWLVLLAVGAVVLWALSGWAGRSPGGVAAAAAVGLAFWSAAGTVALLFRIDVCTQFAMTASHDLVLSSPHLTLLYFGGGILALLPAAFLAWRYRRDGGRTTAPMIQPIVFLAILALAVGAHWWVHRTMAGYIHALAEGPAVSAPPDRLDPASSDEVSIELPPPPPSADDGAADEIFEGGVEGGFEGSVLDAPLGDGKSVRKGAAAPHPAGDGSLTDAEDETPIHVSTDYLESAPLERVPPQYPAVARAARLQGTVVLDIQVNTRGEVSDVRPVSGHPLLQAAAADAVRKWRYKPMILNGRPVPVRGTVTVHFRLAAEEEPQGQVVSP